MKNYVVLAMMMISIHSLGQVYRFRSFESALTKPNEQPANFKWQTQNILIVQDLDKSTIKFYSKTKESVLAIISGSPDTIRPTETYLSSRMKYAAIDEYGEKCIVQVDAYKHNSYGYDIIFYCWYDTKEIMMYKANIID